MLSEAFRGADDLIPSNCHFQWKKEKVHHKITNALSQIPKKYFIAD